MKAKRRAGKRKMVFITLMKTKKESRKGTSGVHSADESQKGEQGREKRCS
jgi:hypothetical protein